MTIHRYPNPVDNALAPTTHDEQIKRLVLIEEQCSQLQHQIMADEYRFVQQGHSLMFDYFTTSTAHRQHCSYTHLLGPARYDLVENPLQIGDYDINNLLGSGCFAKVMVGTHRATRERVALKIMKKDRLANIHVLEQLETELCALQMVQHPIIVSYKGVIHARENIYILLGLGHQDLYNYCHERHGEQITTHTIRQVLIGILQGLAHLHQHGIAHLDVKAENILVTDDVKPSALRQCHIQLCDLGICRMATTEGAPIRLDRICGTLNFFAPEMVWDLPNTDGRRADMWSVGVTLLELIEGLVAQWISTYRIHKKAPLVFQRDIARLVKAFQQRRRTFVNASIHDLICQLLTLDHAKRLTAQQALQHSWIARVMNPKEQSPS